VNSSGVSLNTASNWLLAGSGDTIVALGTALGRGAIAVVRMSGERAIGIARHHVDLWPARPRELRLCTVHDETKVLDQAIVTFYSKPESFTGEDMVEIFTHGGHVVPASVVAALIGSGAREALPGEFTRRAVLNGKIDIVQAEAVGDLVDARSSAMQQTALYQLDGGLSSRIASMREIVLQIESLIAYDVDFPEEDDGPIPQARILEATGALLDSLDLLLSTIPVGQIVREGAVVVIAGKPNVGKSSLFNALLGEQRAIVTEISGTTRDAIEGLMDAGRWPIRLIDTAGLRHSTDVVERLGIETSERHISRAHLIIACGDSQESLEKAVSITSSLSNAPIVRVATKSDSWSGPQAAALESSPLLDAKVSAKTGDGLQLLREKMNEVLDVRYGEIAPEIPILTKTRHIQAIRTARQEIVEFKNAWRASSLPATVAAVHLRTAAVALEGLIGAVSTDDVLERVFSSFCVGK
jgi:tRNA modification GTPase